MNTYRCEPVDTLFFRDARPMQAGAGSGGHGACWPLPTVLHEALRAQLLRVTGTKTSGKTISHSKTGKNGRREKNVASDKFRSLRTLGPFPQRDGEVFLPLPLDVVSRDENGLARLRLWQPQEGEPPWKTNLPADWLRPVVSPVKPQKADLPEWVPSSWFRQYLEGADPLPLPVKKEDKEKKKLFDAEHRIGVAIDPETGTASEGKLYAAEHLRLRDGVSLWCAASLSNNGSEQKNNPLSLTDLEQQVMPLGGEGRLVRIEQDQRDYLRKADWPSPSGTFIKWVLLTHAVFLHGWRPDWIAEKDGRVLLKAGETARREGEDRKAWRERVRKLPAIGAKLVAARVSKPVYFSGWDLGEQGPKPTMLAVPAGSVYYFEADDEEQGRALVEALHLRTRSDHLGEKGMGLGVCGTWTSPADGGNR